MNSYHAYCCGQLEILYRFTSQVYIYYKIWQNNLHVSNILIHWLRIEQQYP
jgi:hypothetical protein